MQPSSAKISVPITSPEPLRLTTIDGLRGCLSLLVVLAHVAISYGAVGGFYYTEPGAEPWLKLLLTTFVAHSQFYFMGLFFLLAGLFIPSSLARKGTKVFLQERFLRLGIPFLIYELVAVPPLGYCYWVFQRQYLGSFGTYLVEKAFKDFSPGPLWFVEALILFTLGFLLWNRLRPMRSLPEVEVTPIHLMYFSLLLAGLSFVVRLIYPIGKLFCYLQLAFFPQYILLFVLGLKVGSPAFLSRLPRHWFWPCVLLTLWGALMIPALVLLNGGIDDRFIGGWHWQAFALCLVESVVCPAACIALVLFFREHTSRFWQVLGANSYGIYLVHAPICVLLSITLRTIALPAFVKFVMVSLLAVGISLLVSHTLRHYGGKSVRAMLG